MQRHQRRCNRPCQKMHCGYRVALTRSSSETLAANEESQLENRFFIEFKYEAVFKLPNFLDHYLMKNYAVMLVASDDDTKRPADILQSDINILGFCHSQGHKSISAVLRWTISKSRKEWIRISKKVLEEEVVGTICWPFGSPFQTNNSIKITK